MDNQSEMAAGTDPTDAASCLRITSFQAGGDVLAGGIQTSTGRVYYVESCLLGETAWKPVTGLIGGQNGVTPWQVTRPTETKAGFYRAVLGVPSDMTKIVPQCHSCVLQGSSADGLPFARPLADRKIVTH